MNLLKRALRNSETPNNTIIFNNKKVKENEYLRTRSTRKGSDNNNRGFDNGIRNES